MRKLFIFNMITVDGFFEGPAGEIDWHAVDKEFNEFAEQQLNEVDLLLFGRKTYELMARYWPTEGARTDDPIIAHKMNTTSKIVFSTTLETAEWNNTRLIKKNVVEEIVRLKRLPGNDIAIFGSAELISTLIPFHVIDEYRIMVNPVLLGRGKPLFRAEHGRLNLSLIKTKSFESGNVLLYYQAQSDEQTLNSHH